MDLAAPLRPSLQHWHQIKIRSDDGFFGGLEIYEQAVKEYLAVVQHDGARLQAF